MRNKRKLNSLLLATTNSDKIASIRTKIADIEKNLKSNYDSWRFTKETEACINIKRNPSAFYRFIRNKSNTKGGIGPFIGDDGEPISNLKDLANILQRQYSSVYSNPDETAAIEDINDFFNVVSDKPSLLDIVVTREDVTKAIGELKISFGAGPDLIPAILLKKCSTSLSIPLATLFNSSIQSGKIPSLLKQAIVVPVHKGGSRTAPAQYRPVSLTSHLMKTLERIVRRRSERGYFSFRKER